MRESFGKQRWERQCGKVTELKNKNLKYDPNTLIN